MRNASLSALAIALLAAALAPPALASFPGRNGQIAVLEQGCPGSGFLDERRHVESFGAGGRDLGALTGCLIPPHYGPEWSPDGSMLGLVAVGENGSQFGWVGGDGADNAPGQVFPDYDPEQLDGGSWSPTGFHVTFVQSRAIWTQAVDGSDKHKLLEAPCDDCRLRDAHWSPTGKRIAFELRGPAKYEPGIWTMRASDGKKLQRISKFGQELDWSPDGTRLVFVSRYFRHSGGAVSGGNVYTVGTDGRHLRRVVHTKRDAALNPAWAPNGRSIAYVTLHFGPGDSDFDIAARLFRVRTRGGNAHAIAKVLRPRVKGRSFYEPDVAWQSSRS